MKIIFKKLKVVRRNLLKYMPNVVVKVIEISEYYEKEKCEGKVHRNTLLLKQIYLKPYKKK